MYFSEAWLENSDKDILYQLPRYNGVISSSHINRRGGWSRFQVKHGATTVRDLKTSLSELIVASVQINKQFLLIMNIYVPLRKDKMAFLSIFDKEVESLTQCEYPTIITGDLNINNLKNIRLTKDCLCTLASNGFHLTKNAILDGYSSRIDLNIVKDMNEVNLKTLDYCLTDHFPLLFDSCILRNVERTERDYRDPFFLKCLQKPIEFENKLIVEPISCYQ